MNKTINISLPEELLRKIDEAAKSEYSSRSDYIRETLVHRLKGRRIVDEWGDSGEWETIVDFREIAGEGVKPKDIIDAIDKMKK